MADAIGMANVEPVEAASLTIVHIEPNRRRDPDNIMAAQKFILDGMVQAGIIEDDGWRHIWSIKHRVLKGEQARVRVEIEAREKREY